MQSLTPILTEGSAGRGNAHHPKTEIVVAVAGGIVVANRRAAIARIVVPRAAPAANCLFSTSSLNE